ncbi:MAG: AsnC family transcriptional regulator [Myxococcota bacterium]|nr:AsnC family transcriptional regulator [Myxococcota bacterium]
MLDYIDHRLLDAVQEGLVPVERPFAEIAERIGLDEAGVIERLRALADGGVIRRIGALFDAGALGYRSTLCSIELSENRLDDLRNCVAAIPEITHCYLRSGKPAVWFTIASRDDARKAEIMRVVGEAAGGGEVADLPARRFYKLHVKLPMMGNGGLHGSPAGTGRERRSEAQPLSAIDRSLVRETQLSMPLVPRPFAEIGSRTGMSEASVVGTLRRWREAGILRRIGAVLYHGEVGFRWNGMCRFPVADEAAAEPIGAAVAAEPFASHGYLRVAAGGPMPTAVYAMVHGRSREEVEEAARRIAASAGVPEPEIWWTEAEIKKTSMRYFEEDAREHSCRDDCRANGTALRDSPAGGMG